MLTNVEYRLKIKPVFWEKGGITQKMINYFIGKILCSHPLVQDEDVIFSFKSYTLRLKE